MRSEKVVVIIIIIFTMHRLVDVLLADAAKLGRGEFDGPDRAFSLV